MTLARSAMAAALGMLIGPAAYPATLALNKSFVQKIMNSATVAANLEVDAYSRSPHPISSGGNDGDLSIAGRAA